MYARVHSSTISSGQHVEATYMSIDRWLESEKSHTCSIVSVLCFVFFGQEACGILISQAGIQPAPSILESEGLTTGLPGKSQ